MRKYLIVILFFLFVLSLFTEMYTFLSIAVTIVVFYSLIDKIGKGITLLETMAIYSCIIYLIMPLLGYAVYTKDSRITVIWAKQMPVPYATYYSFILPAICAYLLGLFLLNYTTGRSDEGEKLQVHITRIKSKLALSPNTGIILIIIGILFYFIKAMVPGPLSAIASFGYLLIFPGLFYVHFQPKLKKKGWIYILVTIFFVRDALDTGMFTVFFYMGITIVSFFLLGKKIRFPIKLATIVAAISCLFVLQLVKGTFRRSTWKKSYTGSKAELFQNLFIEKAGGFDEIFSENTFFPIYVRFNQGLVTSMVMKRIPAKQPYDGGESIAKTLAASVVPRILWPDKPQSGGVYNMQHFAGFKLKGWSTNIGPVGEAYGSFGVGGGIVYMFFFGLFIGWAYTRVFSLSRSKPLLLLWIPLLFFEVMYSMENDTLQAVNSLVKAAVFMWILYKLFPALFKGGNKTDNTKNENRDHLRDNRPGWSLSG